jgi:hypothetical protein
VFVARKLIVSVLAAAALSGLVAASFFADSDAAGAGLARLLLPVLLTGGVALVVAGVIWTVRWRG